MRSRWRLLALRLLAFHLRHGPEHPGRWRLLNWAVHWAPHLRGAGSRTVRGREGFRLVVDGRSQTGRMVYVTGSYEPATSALIRRVLRAGDVMVDVGANIGYFSMLAAKCVTPSGHVLAFEPVESVRNELRTNLRINGITTVDVRDEALGARNESLQLFLGPDTDTGLTSLREMPGSSQVSAKVV